MVDVQIQQPISGARVDPTIKRFVARANLAPLAPSEAFVVALDPLLGCKLPKILVVVFGGEMTISRTFVLNFKP